MTAEHPNPFRTETRTSSDTGVYIDGSRGEGGGQILRTALSLSLITGHPLRIDHIRAGRRKPGLLRQHLTAVRAAAAVGEARVEGADPGSRSLTFLPGRVRGGDLEFAIGTAGSCTLVAQTVLPALLAAGAGARVRLSGGTHNPHAPPADFLAEAFLPLLRRTGADVNLTLLRHGFYPAGGGELLLEVGPGCRLRPLHLEQRGPLRSASALALVAGLPAHIAQRELATLRRALDWSEEQTRLRVLSDRCGPGNALVVTLVHEQVTEVFTGFGAKGVSAEKVASRLAREVRSYLDGGAPVGPYLADQLLLPLAIAGGAFVTGAPTTHVLTNLETIQAFLPGRLTLQKLEGGKVRIEAMNPDEA
jgi:RNA 3'-terminal phosphate cyclase (ATP)